MFQKMKYLRACITESFRLYPTADRIARHTEVDLEVTGGYILPKMSLVFCHHRTAAWREENFTRADAFVPERWIEGLCDPTWRREQTLVRPFGFGKRACPGRKLAETELYITIAKIFQSFHVDLLDDLSVEFNFLLSPTGPLRLLLTPRDDEN